jgi:hypothetical protein
LIWIISLFCSCIITIYLAFVSKTKKKKIIFTLLTIIPTLLSIICILVLIPDNRGRDCRDMADGLPKSLEIAVASNKPIPLDFAADDSCGFKLIDALEDGAISYKDSNLRKKYVCVLYDEANNSDTIKAEILAEVILPKVFYKNPIHSIQCLSTNKSGFYLLIIGLSLSLDPEFKNMNGDKLGMSESKFNTICNELEKSGQLSTENKKKVKLLRKEVIETFRAEQKEGIKE